MIYVKATSDDVLLRKDGEYEICVYGDSFCSVCPKCGREHQLDESIVAQLLEESTLGGTSIYCAACTKTEQDNEVIV